MSEDDFESLNHFDEYTRSDEYKLREIERLEDGRFALVERSELQAYLCQEVIDLNDYPVVVKQLIESVISQVNDLGSFSNDAEFLLQLSSILTALCRKNTEVSEGDELLYLMKANNAVVDKLIELADPKVVKVRHMLKEYDLVEELHLPSEDTISSSNKRAFKVAKGSTEAEIMRYYRSEIRRLRGNRAKNIRQIKKIKAKGRRNGYLSPRDEERLAHFKERRKNLREKIKDNRRNKKRSIEYTIAVQRVQRLVDTKGFRSTAEQLINEKRSLVAKRDSGSARKTDHIRADIKEVKTRQYALADLLREFDGSTNSIPFIQSEKANKFYQRFSGDVNQFKNKVLDDLLESEPRYQHLLGKLNLVDLDERASSDRYISRALRRITQMAEGSDRPEQQGFFQALVSLLGEAQNIKDDEKRMLFFTSDLTESDEAVIKAIHLPFRHYSQAKVLANYQKYLLKASWVKTSEEFSALLENEKREINTLSQSDNRRVTDFADVASSMIAHLDSKPQQEKLTKGVVLELTETMKASLNLSGEPLSVDEYHLAIEKAKKMQASSPESFDKVLYALCEDELLDRLENILLRVVSHAILTDSRFKTCRVSLLPSEILYIQNNLTLRDEALISNVLQYRLGAGTTSPLHANINDVENAYFSTLQDRTLPSGETYTKAQLIEDIRQHGGLIAYERKIIRKNRMLHALERMELSSLSERFWRSKGISEPEKVTYLYEYLPLPAADLYPTPDVNASRSEQLKTINIIRKGDPSYYKIIELKMGPNYLHTVNKAELSRQDINWDADKYRDHLNARLHDLIDKSDNTDKTYFNRALLGALDPMGYTTSRTVAPYFIKPTVYSYPLENMLLLKDQDKYTLVSLLPDSAQITRFESRSDLKAFFLHPNNHEFVLSHASIANQMDGRHYSGIESAINGARKGESGWSILSEDSEYRMNGQDPLLSLARSSMGLQGQGHYVRTNLVDAVSSSYWQGLEGNHTVEVAGDYELPEQFKDAQGHPSFQKLYNVQENADIQRLAEAEIQQFKEEHFVAYSEHLKTRFNDLVTKAWSDKARHPFRESLLINTLYHHPEALSVSIPGLVGKMGQHMPLEGMLMIKDPSKAGYIMISLNGNGALIEFSNKEEVHHFFANPGNRPFLLAHINEYDKQPELYGVATPADSLDVLEQQSKQFPPNNGVGLSAVWSSTKHTFPKPSTPADYVPYPGKSVVDQIREAAGEEVYEVTREVLNLNFIPLSSIQDRSQLFKCLADRNLARLVSDADTLFKSHSEWRTEKALEITGYVLAVPATVLSVGAMAATAGGAAPAIAAGISAAALVVDMVSFGVGVAEGAYLVTQADTAEERMMGLIPLALAPLDLLGAGSSGNDLLKSIKMIKATKTGTKVTQVLDDIGGASVGKGTPTDVARTGGALSHSGTIVEEATGVPSFSPKLQKSEDAVRLSDIINEQLEDIRRGIEELEVLEAEMNEMLQGYPRGTTPLAEAKDFIDLDINNQVMLQRIGQPEIKPGRWGGVLQDHGEPVAAVRSSRGDYIFSDTKIGSKPIGVCANSKGQILSYLDAHSSHVVTSDIEGQSKIYVRVVSRPETARFNGKFPVEDATKAVINGFTNFGVRWGGIPAPIIPGLEGVTPGAIGKPLSSLVARGKKLDFLGRLKMLVGRNQ